MKFSTQLIALIAASSIQAQQESSNTGIEPTTIKNTATATKPVPTNCLVEPCPSETSDSDTTTRVTKNTSATHTNSSSISSPTEDPSASTTDSSDKPSPSAKTTTASSSAKPSVPSTTSNGNQLNGPSKLTYVAAGAAFALIGNYLI